MRRPGSYRRDARISGGRDVESDDSAGLRAANLSAPGFRESWRAGSPLNWSEFIACWQVSQQRDEGSVTSGEVEK